MGITASQAGEGTEVGFLIPRVAAITARANHLKARCYSTGFEEGQKRTWKLLPPVEFRV